MSAKATPKIVSVTINYNASIKGNLERIDPKRKYESVQFSDSESRSYNVEGMTEEEVDQFLAATREEMVERIDGYIMGAYQETFGA